MAASLPVLVARDLLPDPCVRFCLPLAAGIAPFTPVGIDGVVPGDGEAALVALGKFPSVPVA